MQLPKRRHSGWPRPTSTAGWCDGTYERPHSLSGTWRSGITLYGAQTNTRHFLRGLTASSPSRWLRRAQTAAHTPILSLGVLVCKRNPTHDVKPKPNPGTAQKHRCLFVLPNETPPLHRRGAPSDSPGPRTAPPAQRDPRTARAHSHQLGVHLPVQAAPELRVCS